MANKRLHAAIAALTLGTTMGASTASAATQSGIHTWGPKPSRNGAFVISVRQGKDWHEVGRVTGTKFPQAATVQLPDSIAKDKTVHVRITREGGGAAYLDSVRLGNRSGELLTASSQEKRKGEALLAQDDRNLFAFTKPIELAFERPAEGSLDLQLTGRIERVIISTTPFQYPADNMFREISASSDFLSYKLGSIAGNLKVDGKIDEVAGAAPFLKEYSVSGSGHPSGDTYFWVRNDKKNLYVSVDFTPDNTMDGNKDYAKVYAKTKSGVKEFKVSMAERKWGVPGFGLTPRASYIHKSYELRIPLSALDLDTKQDRVELAFATYGTASPGSIFTDAAYDPLRNRYLAVFGWTDVMAVSPFTVTEWVRGQFLDSQGAPLGVTFAANVTAGAYFGNSLHPAVAYNPRSDAYLIAWGQAIGTCCTNTHLYVRAISGDGSLVGNQIQLTANHRNPTSKNVAIAADPQGNGFVVTWVETEADGTQSIYETSVAADGTPATAQQVAWSGSTNLGTLRMVANTVDHAYLVSYNSGSNYAIKQLTGTGAPVGVTTAEVTVKNTSGFDVAYDAENNRYLAAWVESFKAVVGALDPVTGGTTPVNGSIVDSTATFQYSPRLLVFSNPVSYVAAWQENRDSAGASELYWDTFAPAEATTGTIPYGNSETVSVTAGNDFVTVANTRCNNVLFVIARVDYIGNYASTTSGPTCAGFVSVDATSGDFGKVEVGQVATLTFTVSNVGGAGLTLGTLGAANALAAPFSIGSDACSGKTLAADASCTVTLKFAPENEGTFTDTVALSSNDQSVTFTLNGEGTAQPNSAPSAPKLIAPQDGAVDVAVPVTFYWHAAKDADGGKITYEVHVCEKKDFSGCEGVKAAANVPRRGFAPWGATAGFVVFGVIVFGLRDRRRMLGLAFVGMVGLAAATVSCGDAKSTDKAKVVKELPPELPKPPSGLDVHMKAIDGLKPATQYYWKVVAVDPVGAKTASEVWSFTTK